VRVQRRAADVARRHRRAPRPSASSRTNACSSAICASAPAARAGRT
jgi:hypothetical protein